MRDSVRINSYKANGKPFVSIDYYNRATKSWQKQVDFRVQYDKNGFILIPAEILFWLKGLTEQNFDIYWSYLCESDFLREEQEDEA